MTDASLDDILRTKDTYVDKDFDEGGEPVLPGEHLAEIEEVTGDMYEFKGYTGPRATLKLRVIDEKDESYNRCVWDRINLPHPEEKDGNRKRRALILSRLGFLTRGDQEIEFDWKRLEGMQVVIDTEENNYTDSNGKPRQGASVKFSGYWLPDKQPGELVKDFDDAFGEV